MARHAHLTWTNRGTMPSGHHEITFAEFIRPEFKKLLRRGVVDYSLARWPDQTARMLLPILLKGTYIPLPFSAVISRPSVIVRFSPTILLAVLALAAIAITVRGQEAPADYLPEPAGDVPKISTQFERGQPRTIIDSAGWVFGIPKKIILWDRRAVNHDVSPDTEQNLARYLEANGLTSTKVRINQYDPIGEWQRLRANKRVGAGWRYTVGALGTLVYTVVPGRVFGTDGYNPYTDTINVYSDIPCLAQEQGGYAKLVHARPHPGTYAVVASLPVVQLWPEKKTKTDVLDYTLANGTPEEQQEAKRVLYAEYGAEVGGQASLLVGSNLPLTLAGAGIGHVAAHFSAPEATDEPAPPEATGVDANATADQKNDASPENAVR